MRGYRYRNILRMLSGSPISPLRLMGTTGYTRSPVLSLTTGDYRPLFPFPTSEEVYTCILSLVLLCRDIGQVAMY
jgi:hypothetical protein